MKVVAVACVVLMVWTGPVADAQESADAGIYNDTFGTAGIGAGARTYLPAGGRGVSPAGSGTSAPGPASARWVSSACLARPPWFGRTVVSWEAGTCLTGTPEQDDPEASLPSPQQLAWIAADQAMAVAERPDLRIAPGRVGLTGLRSFFWLEHAPPRVWATASVPGVLVTAEAFPIRYGWAFGEGEAKSTTGIGRPWSRRGAGAISHMYERRGTYQVTVDVIWQARWRIGTGPWMHLGYFSNQTARDYPVREMVSRLTRN